MPNGASSQNKLFSYSQSGETLSQSKSHHPIPPPYMLAWLSNKGDWYGLPFSSIYLPAPCPGSEHQARDSGPH